MSGRVCVCLVDDDPLIRDAAGMALSDRGYAVVLARNGAEGLAAIERGLPDVVVTDIVMPDADAFEFLPLLRDRYPQLPVVAMSGGGEKGTSVYLRVASKLGARECLNKPFSIETLVNAIERARGMPTE